jgi:tight adherence protein C
MFFLLRIIIPIRMGYFAFIVCSLVSCMIGYYLPNIWLKARIAGRKQRIQDGFPDALDLLVVSVEAGAGLDAAFARVGEEMRLTHEDLSNELQLMHRELKAGRSRRNALLALGLRVGLEDVNNLVILLNQSERFGTGIAQSLRVHSEFMRTKRSQRAEEMAAKLPVKMMIPLILFIFPAMLIVILGPAAIRIMRVLLTT